MYPSGPWRGYWEQQVWGRQEMHDLVLLFQGMPEGGIVDGRGRDIIGDFTLGGRYDDQGKVTLVKQYVGRHRVLYQGSYDGEGTIFGQWSIGADWSGPFALSPVQRRAAVDGPIQEL